MKRVYFINPLSGLKPYHYEIPLNIAQLVACLEKTPDVQIQVIDFNLKGLCKQTIEDIPNSIDTIICIPVYTYAINESVTIIELLKSKDEITIIVGGPHISLRGKEFLEKYRNVSFGLVGEGDYTLPKLIKNLNCFEKNSEKIFSVEGLIYRNGKYVFENKKPKRIECLDILPLQTDGFKYFDLDLIKSKIGFAPYIASRGCCFNCIYCSSSNLWGGKLKYLAPQIAAKEIFNIREMGFHIINFRDDFFTMNRKWLSEFLKEIKKLKIQWGCETRIDFVDYEILKEMRAAGCILIRFGIETFNQKSLNLLGKCIDSNLILHNLRTVLGMGFLEVRASFIIGIPYETHEDIKRTLDTCKQLTGLKCRFFALNPVIGTKLYDSMEEYKIKFNNSYNATHSNIETSELSNYDINKVLDDIYDEFGNPNDYSHRDFSTILSFKN